MTRRRLAAAALLVLLQAACGPASPPADITVAHDAEPQTLDPALMTGVAEGRIAGALFEGLTRLDPESLEARPGVAEGFDVSPDGLTWTFRLRRDARWSDGRPVTSEDFRWSWLRVLDPRTAAAYAGLLFEVRGARAFLAGEGGAGAVGLECPDEWTLRVRLERPVPYFPSLAAFFTLLPVPRHAVEEHGDRWTRAGNIVTNGPFRLERWAFYREIVLRRSPDYWDRGNVRVERIRLLPVVDPNTQFNLYETGAVDLIFSVPSPILHRLADRPDFVHGPRLATAFLRINVTRPPFDDPTVRAAVSMAIDREALVTRITRGGEIPTGAFVPPGLPGYEPAPGLGFQREKARNFLEHWAGYPGGRGFPRVALLVPDNPDYAAIATVLQHQLRENLGLDVSLDSREWKVYLSSMRSLDYDIAFGQWIGDYPDATTFLDCFRSDSGNNRTGWKEARYDDLLERAGRETGPRRAKLLGQAEGLLLFDAPIVPLYHPTVRYMVAPRVRGFRPNMMGLVRFADLSVGGR